MKIILINGKKRSGKDFFAKCLQIELFRLGKTSEIMSFADPIKDIVGTALNLSLDELDNYKNKNEPINIQDKQITNVRRVLQNFGTDAMKKYFGEEVWVNLLVQKANKSNVDFIIIPDFRFLCENIPGSITVKIRNEVVERGFKDTHISENELNDFQFQYVIDNTGYKNITPALKQFISHII